MAITKAYYQEYKGTTRYFQQVYKFRDKNMIMTLVLKYNLRVLIVWVGGQLFSHFGTKNGHPRAVNGQKHKKQG